MIKLEILRENMKTTKEEEILHEEILVVISTLLHNHKCSPRNAILPWKTPKNMLRGKKIRVYL